MRITNNSYILKATQIYSNRKNSGSVIVIDQVQVPSRDSLEQE
jgi:hypothetical protein